MNNLDSSTYFNPVMDQNRLHIIVWREHKYGTVFCSVYAILTLSHTQSHLLISDTSQAAAVFGADCNFSILSQHESHTYREGNS